MAAPRIFNDDTRDDIYRLNVEDGLTAVQIHDRLSAGPGETPSLQRIREILREEKRARGTAIEDMGKAEQLASLTNGLVKVADAEITRLLRAKGEIDADQLLKLANTVKTLEPLLKPEPSKQRADKPVSFLEVLPGTTNDADTDKSDRNSEAHSADRSLRTQAA